ncbi:MAG: toll/interleukin-1 receptor domain-containing protein [Planctomycetes bacterium]|nr:toll/interleukin-1 receptor domain-containing protein [Planctomycetota bacterium]
MFGSSPTWVYCKRCSFLTTSGKTYCEACPYQGEVQPVNADATVGLVGLVNSGKSAYLAALYYQLSKAGAEWGLEEVSWSAAKMLFDSYRQLQKGAPLNATLPGDRMRCFPMKVRWEQNDPVELFLWDASGEDIAAYAEGRDTNEHLKVLLPHCKSIFVTISATPPAAPRRAPIATEEDADDPPAPLRRDPQDEDHLIAELFRRLLAARNRLRQVIVLLADVERLGQAADEVANRARQEFADNYKMFCGVLRTRSVVVETVPISVAGLGNTWERVSDGVAPKPHNVLESLRRIVPHYLPVQPWWRRLLSYLKPRDVPAPTGEREADPSNRLKDTGAEKEPSVPAPHEQTTVGSVFICYRRNTDSATARALKTELEKLGWSAFYDREDLGPGYYDKAILNEIEKRDGFLVILSPGALDRCLEPEDFVRREIAHAIAKKKCIVPIKKTGFDFPRKSDMPEEICELPRHQAIDYSDQYFKTMVTDIVKFVSARMNPPVREPG